jgi:hypothetical protein
MNSVSEKGSENEKRVKNLKAEEKIWTVYKKETENEKRGKNLPYSNKKAEERIVYLESH